MENKSINAIKNPPNFRGIFYLKTLSLLIILCLLNSRIYSQSQLKFTETKKKFEDVKKGEVVTLEYEFVNAGNAPLIITDSKVECSCTSVDYPKEPILPNLTGKVIVKFDTKTVYERQDRVVEIISNAKNSPTKIRFKGFVIKN